MIKLKCSRAEPFRENDLFVAAELKPAGQKVQEDGVRPNGLVDQRKSKWILGDVAEVLDRNVWKLGKIAKVLKNNYFIMRLSDCILLREFHISSLRVPHAHHHSKKLPALHRATEQSTKTRPACLTFPCSKFVSKLGHQGHEEEGLIAKRYKAINLCSSTSARNLKNKLEPSSRMPLDNLLRGTGKKRKAAGYESHQPTKKRTLPQKVESISILRDDIANNCICRPFSDKHSDRSKINTVKRNHDVQVFCSSRVPFRVREEDDECSVASCSINDLEHSTNDNQQSIRFDDAMSVCPSTSRRDDNNVSSNELDANIHELELQAYQSTVRAFYASGPLTWEQESLLTNLRLSLNISNEEHLLQLRHLLSS